MVSFFIQETILIRRSKTLDFAEYANERVTVRYAVADIPPSINKKIPRSTSITFRVSEKTK